MVRMLIERGHVISKPHAPDCLCSSCKTFLRDSGSSMSQIRLNAYKAVANPTYIWQVTDDPILYCFEIDREIETCSDMDKEFKVEYEQLGTEVRDFTVQLLS
ncbi:hypothetical protein JTE90_004845 [Oedothorax gibbosus]|uniref:Transient receptor ion channel domain-containing protein n=1 Tax=Oedothorax gibbosus TaxID=931172 RepID=A0AAV6UQD4_9ARAC|nr:hypothetical protein JTE90_004845 [Oedothorax gibbosus]